MSTDYKGWKVPEDIIIVSKECRTWSNGHCVTTGDLQGYVVEPGNESMLKSAHNWAKWTEYVGEYNTATRSYDQQIEHLGVEHRFKNDGFTLELLETAGGSSQGGKLSFWNCKVSKDGKEFIVGIASDYLLEILLHNDFKNGVCQSTLSFARCKSGVGMMNKSMPSYQQFLKDEEHRAAIKKGKTKKRVPGHLYSTLTGGDVYFTTFYRWYEPVYRETPHYTHYWCLKDLIGFKKLEVPVVRHWSPWYVEEFTKKSEYFNHNFYFSDTTPARKDGGVVAEIDITDEDMLKQHLENRFTRDIQKYTLEVLHESVGLSLNKDSYTMPDWIRKVITDRGYKLFE